MTEDTERVYPLYFSPKGLSRKKTKPTPDLYYIKDGDFDIVWANVFIFATGHLLCLYAPFAMLQQRLWYTWMYAVQLGYWVGLAIGCGAHRLWSHKSYSATVGMRIFLMIGQSIAGQNSIYIWCRDHRVHHKFSDTDGDPHNTGRGYFFSHVGWLLRKKHPEMRLKAKTLDFSDLMRDPVVKFQHDYYWQIYLLLAFLIPIYVPVLLWNETWWNSFLLSYVGRYLGTLHCTWFVNSTAHMYGDRPYNGDIMPVENAWVSFGTFGEGYHNYHHTFPWDYRASELPYALNISKMFIDYMARLGYAFNLKMPTQAMIDKSRLKQHRAADADAGQRGL